MSYSPYCYYWKDKPKEGDKIMNKGFYVGIGILTVALVLGGSIISTGISLYNQEIALKNQIEAKQTENKANFDNMWKKIKQTTNVSDEYKTGLVEVVKAYTEGRKDTSENMLMKWGAEAVPNFDSSIYKQLMNIIVASRDDFTLNQKELLDLNREHDTLIDTFPNNVFYRVMGVQKIKVTTVTSTRTEETFKSGIDDEV